MPRKRGSFKEISSDISANVGQVALLRGADCLVEITLTEATWPLPYGRESGRMSRAPASYEIVIEGPRLRVGGVDRPKSEAVGSWDDVVAEIERQ